MTSNITKSTEILKASYRLTLFELRIILFGISKTSPMYAMSQHHTVDSREMAEFYDAEPSDFWRQIKSSFCEKFFDRRIIIKDKQNTTIISHWIYEIELDDYAQTITYTYNPCLLAHLSELENRFTSYGLKYIAKMGSMYSIRFYEWAILALKEANSDKISFFKTIDELKQTLTLEDKYKQLSDFKKRVLDVAAKEITSISNITFSYHIERTGNYIKHIEFIAEYKEKSKKDENIVMVNTTRNTLTAEQVQKFAQIDRLKTAEQIIQTDIYDNDIDKCTNWEQLKYNRQDVIYRLHGLVCQRDEHIKQMQLKRQKMLIERCKKLGIVFREK